MAPQFNIRQIERIWHPILQVVSVQSGVTLKLNASTSIPAFEKEFERGEFHFVYMNPFFNRGLNEDQEQVLIKFVQDGVDESLGRFEQGISIDEQMNKLFSWLERIS